jgi:hypothetical protein
MNEAEQLLEFRPDRRARLGERDAPNAVALQQTPDGSICEGAGRSAGRLRVLV